jgi:hypothetical protein
VVMCRCRSGIEILCCDAIETKVICSSAVWRHTVLCGLQDPGTCMSQICIRCKMHVHLARLQTS